MLSPIGLGCWQLSKGKGIGGRFCRVLEDSEITEIVSASLRGGVNWFDTAESYGWGESERSLSQALLRLGKSSEDVVIATKWMPHFRTSRSIVETIDKRLENLNGFSIDLYQIHHPRFLSSLKAEMKAMAQLIDKRKIRYAGVSNYSAKRMRRAHLELKQLGYHLISNQVRYNLIDRKIETNGVLDTARELAVALIAYSPLAKGLLSGKYSGYSESVPNPSFLGRRSVPSSSKKPKNLLSLLEALKDLAEQHKVTPAQIALNWLINFHEEVIFAIPGATNAAQAEENAAAMKFRLSKSDLAYLDSKSAVFRN
ncbi:MAG: aldo/keto reductase [Candidatus Aminicenantes bacterium]|nr:aldo/keto reductase [Candidatus Aminicenantes bacterium]